LTSITPNNALTGSAAFTLTATGTGFASGSQIIWNGTALTPTTFGSSTSLTATVPAADLVAAIPVNVFVLNPDSTASNFLPFTINASTTIVPTLAKVTPNYAPVGSPAVTITLTGTNFASSAIANFGTGAGSALATTFVSSTQLTAVVPAALLTEIGQFNVTVSNSSTATTGAIPFRVGVNAYFGEVNDVVWDSARNTFYVSSPTSSSKNPDTVLALNPVTAVTKVLYSAAAKSNPDRLALSDDGKYLYVGLDGANSVQQLVFGQDISATPGNTIVLGSDPNLGPYYPLDVEVAPGDSNTIAVSRGINGGSAIVQAQGGVAIYDGTVQRANVVSPINGAIIDTIQWGADSSTLYGADNESGAGAGDFYTLSVTPAGAALTNTSTNFFTGENLRIHYDSTNGLVYGDDGRIVNPIGPTGPTLQNPGFLGSGIMIPDSAIGDAYFVGQPSVDNLTVSYLVESFNITTYAPVARFPLSQIEGQPQHLIRWGSDGLAFNTKKVTSAVCPTCTTGDGQLYILSGPFVTQTAP
jgi:hypothetical protein